MSDVYSTLFVSNHGASEATVVEYEFPGGYVYVVVDMEFFSSAPGAAQFSAYDENLTTFYNALGTSATSGVWAQWQGRQVFAGGTGKLYLSATYLGGFGESWDVRVSGYRLYLP